MKSYVEENNSLIAHTNNNNKDQKLPQNTNDLIMNDKTNDYNNINNTKNNDEINNLNDNKNNKNELIVNNIDDKYKNLENPFTTPEIEKKDEKEDKRAKIMNRINKGREKAKSRSVDTKYKKSDDIQKLANNLEKHLFKEENNINYD